MPDVKKVLIVGGGIGGLAAGIALRQVGIQAEIVELQNPWNVYGVGIIQPSNALRALGQLGVADACMTQGSPFSTFKICLPNGHVLMEASTPPLGRYPANNGIPRNKLHKILCDAATQHGATIRMGTTVTHIENTPAHARVTFSDGAVHTYDLVVGADGINSKVRGMVFPNAPKPRYTGQSVWRVVVNRPAGMEWGEWYYGRSSKTGLVPMTPDTMYLALVSMEGDNPRLPDDQLLPLMRERFAEYTAPTLVETLAQVNDSKSIVYRPLETMMLPDPWYHNRVVIIGDAAHATLPQLGQGASIAIEDAIVLAELLQHDSAVPDLLKQFMARRFERCKMIVDVSYQLGEWEREEWLNHTPPNPNYGPLMGGTLHKMMEEI